VPLVDRVHELATRWGPDMTTEAIEKALDVRLTVKENGFAGSSTRWPVAVLYVPVDGDRGPSLHLSLTDLTLVTLGDVEKRFGPPVSQVQAKESRAVFSSASGVRVVVLLVGGLAPSSSVGRIQLRKAAQKEPSLPDLF